jgi:GTPase SAR1 family protein
MDVKLTVKVSFPKDFPPATAGILLLDRNILITGHENGFLVEWNIIDGSYQILLRSDSPVMTISYSGSNRIAVGYHSGGLFVLDLKEKHNVKTVRIPKYSVNSRIWRTTWASTRNLLLTSTYGEITSFYESGENWIENYMGLKGHSDSVFGIDSINGKYIATGDYKGKIIIWEFADNQYLIVHNVGVVGNIQDVHWHSEQCFAAITNAGKIYLFESPKKEKVWQTVVEVNVANSRGVCVNVTEDGKTIFAGTDEEIIQFDLDSYQSETIDVPNVKRIFSSKGQIYVLTSSGLYCFERTEIRIKKEFINYKFVKISLLGHTGTGKTTFCNRMLSSSINSIHSTFGKRIFTWRLKKEKEIEKRMMFHDHGGQETVLDTFIPFLQDSDIILIFYRQTDETTFNKSIEILDEIRDKVSRNIPVYFVQTFINHELDAIPHEIVEGLIENKKIVDCAKISPKDNIGIDDFRKRLLESIDWELARIMVQSPYIDGVSKTLSVLQDKGYPVIPFDTFKQTYQDVIGTTISARHLRFLLEDYTNQGIIEYYPKISELIILDDAPFNKMRTDVPIYADQMDGVVNINDIHKKFDNDTLLPILDEMYLQSGIAIKNEELRIFPHRLSEKALDLPEEYKKDLADKEPFEIFVAHQKIEIGRLIELLSELHLQCIRLTKQEGLFSWEKSAYVYYFAQEERRGVSGKYVKFGYFIGGNNAKIKDRLGKSFFAAVERAFGPTVDITAQESKKKLAETYEFDVTLSFAGEQREYVERVASILARKGLKVFYDRFEQSQMWGENLIEYFQEVYYSKAKFCIMFISNDYLRKMWPVHERRSATARDLEEFGRYILPVIFEDVDVPGLDKYKGYLDARKCSPEYIAEMFLEKLLQEAK